MTLSVALILLRETPISVAVQNKLHLELHLQRHNLVTLIQIPIF
jgi:hypothetical protein